MVKVTIENEKAFQKGVDLLVEKRVEKGLKRLEASVRKQESDYKSSIREGINPKTGKPYKGLASSTKTRRGRLATVNKTHHKYKKNKSNLTFTGELIDSITFAVKAFKRKLRINIRMKGTHSRYMGIRGKPIGKRVSNAKIAEYLAGENGKDRPIIGMSKKRAREIITNLKAFIKRG